MPDLTIHEIPQEELDALAARGARHGRTLEDEARHLLHEAAAEQLLVAQLQQASVVEAKLETAQRPRIVAPAGRRRVRYEPTPRR
jgi:plasmid stability protein